MLGDIVKEWDSVYDVIHKNDVYSLILNKQSWNDITIPHGVYAKMGNILYRLPESFPSKLGLNWLYGNEILCLNVPIGELTFTTSREVLEDNEANLTALKVYADKLIDFIKESITKKLDSIATPWEAYQEFIALTNIESRVLGQSKLYWRGDEYDIKSLSQYGWMIYIAYRGRWMSNNGGNVSNRTCFIVNDGGFPQYTTSERRELARNEAAKEDYDPVYIPLNKSNRDAWFANPLLNGAKVIRLSKYAVARRAKVYKKSKDVLLWNGKTHFPHSTNWDEIEVNKIPKTATYVYIEKFRPSGCHASMTKVSRLAELLSSKCAIYGVRITGNKKQVSPKWTTLEQKETQLITTLSRNKKFVDFVRNEMSKGAQYGGASSYLFLNIKKANSDNLLDPDIKDWLDITKDTKTQKDEPQLSAEERVWIGKARQVYNDYNYHPLFNQLIVEKIKKEISRKVDSLNTKLKNIERKIQLAYPLLDVYTGYSHVSTQTIEDYLNAMYLYSQSKSQ